MSIILNDNIKVKAGKPYDPRYLATGNTAYSSTTEVNITIPITQRYIGLTVNVNNTEYWYKSGVADINLTEKKLNTIIDTTDLISGATNIGYFSGYTGTQILPLNHLTDDDYDGNYISMYNSYYRNINGTVCIGTPTDGIIKRGYLKNVAPTKSFIWSEYSGGSEVSGWALIDGNISDLLGTFQSGELYYNGTTTYPYTGTTWSGGTSYNNGSNLVIDTVTGSLTTGTTLTIGGRPYSYKEDNLLHFRTIKSETPGMLGVRDDGTFVYLSGNSQSYSGDNVGVTGIGIYSGTTNNVHYFRRLVGSGDTIVSQLGNEIIIYSEAQDVNYPTLIGPSSTISVLPSGSTFEIGCEISTLCVTGIFDSGCIDPQYPPTASDKRSCNALSYNFCTPISTCYNSTNPSYTHILSGYTVTDGVQTWGVCVDYDEGVQPYDSIGNFYCIPLSSGSTPYASSSFTGVLPWYWGVSTGITVNASCVAECGCSVYGGKCVETVNGESISMCFNSVYDDYLWFAIPTGSTAKTCWNVDGANNGCIGGTGNLFANSCVVAVSSCEGCWVGCNYDVYISCYPTGTETDTLMYIC